MLFHLFNSYLNSDIIDGSGQPLSSTNSTVEFWSEKLKQRFTFMPKVPSGWEMWALEKMLVINHIDTNFLTSACTLFHRQPAEPFALLAAAEGSPSLSHCFYSESQPCHMWSCRTCHLPAQRSCGFSQRWQHFFPQISERISIMRNDRKSVNYFSLSIWQMVNGLDQFRCLFKKIDCRFFWFLNKSVLWVRRNSWLNWSWSDCWFAVSKAMMVIRSCLGLAIFCVPIAALAWLAVGLLPWVEGPNQ